MMLRLSHTPLLSAGVGMFLALLVGAFAWGCFVVALAGAVFPASAAERLTPCETSDEEVVAPADPTQVTHTLQVGNVVFGFSNLGGGYMNFLSVEGDTNLVARGFGRGGQASTRDWLHSTRHNPTQAGYRDMVGMPCVIRMGGSSIVLVRSFPAPLFGNPNYDFTEHEDIWPDIYPFDGGNSDKDSIPEGGLTQADEIMGEFDYAGRYEDVSDWVDGRIPIVRHFFQWDYVREPDQIYQFGRRGEMDDGSPPLREQAFVDDVSPDPDIFAPPDTTDYSFAINTWSFRIRWTEGFHTMMWMDGTGAWQAEDITECNARKMVRIFGDQNLDLYTPPPSADAFLGGNPSSFAGDTDHPFILLVRGSDPDTSLAVGLYTPPESPCNAQPIVGVHTLSGTVVYEEDRRMRVVNLGNRRACGLHPDSTSIPPYITYLDSVTVENDLNLILTRCYCTGLLAPGKIEDGVHERMRMDVYLLVGTPNEIADAISDLVPLVGQQDCVVEPAPQGIPSQENSGSVRLRLERGEPNPFGPQTMIHFTLPAAGSVHLSVHDPAGSRVRTLLDGVQTAGAHEIVWDGCDERGRALPTGIYIVRLTSSGRMASRKLALIR